jgi:DNA-binding transcriptional ArsR family regulator
MVKEKQKGVEKMRSMIETLENYNRLAITSYLNEHLVSSFTNLRFDTDAGTMNPSSIKHHAKILIDAGIVEKKGRGRYALTNAGKVVYKDVAMLSELQ